MKVTVLLSGGVDSAACVAFYQRGGHEVSAMHINYGQAARASELLASQALATHYSLPLQIINVIGATDKAAGEIVGRNAFLVSLALQELGYSSQIISLGIHAGTGFCDCSPLFLELVNRLWSLQTDGLVQLGAPFVNWSKKQIWDFSKSYNVPIDITYSCESSDVPCGECHSCGDRRHMNAR